MNFATVWAIIGDYTIAAALGAVVSSGEIVARYRDEPWDTLRSVPAMFYMLINALASMGALTIVRTFGMNFGASEPNAPLIQVLVAGLGAMMIFRSAFFTLRVNDQDVAVGAASFLQVMLDAVDREVDRRRAILRAGRVRRIMETIAFEKALTALPTYCIALMQNLDESDQRKLLGDLKVLVSSAELEPPVKAQILGLAVMNYLGEEVLQASVDALRAQIQNPGIPGQTPVEPPPATASTLGKILDRFRNETPVGKSALTIEMNGESSGNASSQPPASAPQASPPNPVEKQVNIARVLSRVREQTNVIDGTPETSAVSQPIENHTVVSFPVDAQIQ